MDLFRRAALAWRAEQKMGNVTMAAPPAGWLLTVLLMSLVIGVISFLSLGEYARKETVRGFVDDAPAVKRVVSSRPGRLRHLPVSEGQPVRAGDVVAVIETDRDLEPLIREYQFQIRRIREQLRLLETTRETEGAGLRARLGVLEASIDRMERIETLQERKVARVKEIIERSRSLSESGHLSRLEWNNLQERLASEEQQAERQAAEMQQLRGQLEETRFQLRRLAPSVRARELELERQISQLRQEQARLLRQQKIDITAPIDGEIRTVLKRDGDFVEPGRPILVIMPHASTLHATLLVPVTSIAFLEPGQQVNIHCDAYPHRRFGSFRGRIVHLSNHVITPRDADLPLPISGPFYLARVSISDVDDYAGDDLLPGMTLQADILLESRTLFEWLLEPFEIRRSDIL